MANRIAGMQIVLISALVLIAANMPAGPLPRATATGKTAAAPTPTPPQAASSAPIMNTPQHAPDQLDFGNVSGGASSRRTFSLTTNAAGYVVVSIPPGPFRVVEFRELGPKQGGSKSPGANSGLTPQVKSRISYREDQPGPFQWSMAPNVQIQIDVVFELKSQGAQIGGQKSAIMNITGPGPHGSWVITVPLRATVSGMKGVLA